MVARIVLIALMSLVPGAMARADEQASYAPGKVVYDFSRPNAQALSHLLDRASLLQRMYGHDPFDASIVIVVHEDAIPLFARKNREVHGELMRRAESLAMGEIIEFRLCGISARMQGYAREDFGGFVTVVPMADAEIVRLQRAGYAYLN